MKNLPKLSPTSYAILGLLARSPQSAYELNARMQTSALRAFWPRAESHVYSEPKKLLAHELVTERTEQAGMRKRTVYTITTDGRKSLADWLGETDEATLRMQAEYMLKLVLADNAPPEDAITTLQQSLQSCQADIEQAIEGIRRILAAPDSATEGMPYNGIVINLTADMLIARYRWTLSALDTLTPLDSDSGDEAKQAIGRSAYAEALEKMEQALAKGD